jgi:hypothetical protein
MRLEKWVVHRFPSVETASVYLRTDFGRAGAWLIYPERAKLPLYLIRLAACLYLLQPDWNHLPIAGRVTGRVASRMMQQMLSNKEILC